MNASQHMAQALTAYILAVDYAKRKVNPEDWEDSIDWENLERQARIALNIFDEELARKARELG